MASRRDEGSRKEGRYWEMGDGRKKRRSRWSLALKKLLDLGRHKSDGRGRGRARHGWGDPGEST
jgi:hypothetical protein